MADLQPAALRPRERIDLYEMPLYVVPTSMPNTNPRGPEYGLPVVMVGGGQERKARHGEAMCGRQSKNEHVIEETAVSEKRRLKPTASRDL